MNDKTLDNAYNNFWSEVTYRKPKKRKQIKTVNVRMIREPSVQRMSLGYQSSTRPSIRSLPTQRQQPTYADYYKQKSLAINRQADYLLAQKRLYHAKAAARKAGYRSPSEKALEFGKIAGQKTGVGVGAAIGRVREASKGSDWKEKIRLLRGKSIYD
jgi:formylglycine-generating enzyme required for sulfatase activity